MAIFDFLFGKKEKMNQMPTMTPQQQDVMQQLLYGLGGGGGMGGLYGQAQTGLQQYLDPSSEAMQQFEAPYRQKFEQETIPMLAERFASAGGGMGGALSSSGFGQALGGAASNFETQMAGLKTGMQRQAIADIMDQYLKQMGMGLGAQSFGYWNQKPTTGLIPGILQSAASGFGQGLGGGMGGFSGIGR